MKGLRLSEELLLLAFNEKKGRITSFKLLVVNFGLSGALLWELIDLGKLELNDEKIKVLNIEPTGDPLLDKILNIIDDTKKDKKVQYWISKLCKKEFRTTIFENLLSKGILRKIEDKDLDRPFRKKRYKLWFNKPLKQTQRNIQDILIHGKTADHNSLRLIGLTHACNLYSLIFKESGERATAKEKAKTLSEEDKIRKGIRSAVNSRRFSVISGLGPLGMAIADKIF
jgi:Golgi phosphoprotein 3